MACIFCNQDVQTLRAKRKMYVWTCTKGKMSCNLTCYNVQYVCIVFDWGNFYAERHLFSLFSTPTFLIQTFTVPSQIFAVCSCLPPCRSFMLQQLADVQPCFLCYGLIQPCCSSWLRSQNGVSTKLIRYGVMEKLRPCFTLPFQSIKLLYLSDRGHVIAVLY